MSLAAVRVPISDFQAILKHLQTGSRGYGNMHLREMRKAQGKSVIRYLHAMVANSSTIEGAVSGPGIYWRYRLTSRQLTVLVDNASAKERARIAREFLKEILARVAQEQRGMAYAPKRTKGQFYLKRHSPGSPSTSAACAAALAAGVLDPAFLALLGGWDLLLYQH